MLARVSSGAQNKYSGNAAQLVAKLHALVVQVARDVTWCSVATIYYIYAYIYTYVHMYTYCHIHINIHMLDVMSEYISPKLPLSFSLAVSCSIYEFVGHMEWSW